jgi:hypothetical protein
MRDWNVCSWFSLSFLSLAHSHPSNTFFFSLFLSLVCFRLYDVDGSGFLERRSLQLILDSLQKSTNNGNSGFLNSFGNRRFTSTEQFLDHLFSLMDLDGDGRISFDDYKEGSRKNPDIFTALQLF